MKNTESVATVSFPEPQGIKINMMPFVMGDPASLPENLRPYQPLIDACGVEKAEMGKIGYLTIMESDVEPGLSQRRGGVHVEKHPAGSWGGGGWGRGNWGGGGWGRGLFSKRRLGGLYIASNMEGTTAVWDAHIDEPGLGGDCEHLGDSLGQPTLLRAGELAWMTDSCPHASMPVPRAGTRQFFRLVTSAVDLWYEQHSTPNPLGIVPPPNVRLISESKFANA